MVKKGDKFKNVLVELRPSKITPKGVGVFAVTRIKKGTKVFEGVHIKYFKHLVTWSVFHKLSKITQRKILDFCIGTPQGFIPPDNFDFNSLAIEWYLNHSCDGNIGFDNVGDFVAIKDIKSSEELSYDYGLIESNPKFQMRCSCKNPQCRKLITGNDWKWIRNCHKKFRFVHPYLKMLDNPSR